MNKNGKNRYNNENMPYEKFLRFGPQALTESELLAIILRTGTRERSALDLAQEVLALTKPPREGLLGLYDIPLEKLEGIRGIGQVKAVKLKCITELSMRLSTARAREGLIVRDPSTVAGYFMEKLRHLKTESVVLACFDAKGQLLSEKMLSSGSVRMSLISPREIFLEALRAQAVSIILIHNHPSGDPSPSQCDKDLTRKVKEMGDTLDIPLLDHIVIGDGCYVSFREAAFL